MSGLRPSIRVARNGLNLQAIGLPSLRDIEYDPAITKTRISDAYRRLRAGETVINPFGDTLFVDKRTLAHLSKRGRSPSELAARLSELDAAEETVRHPHEVWQGEQKTRRIYIRMVSLPNGERLSMPLTRRIMSSRGTRMRVNMTIGARELFSS